MRQQSCVDVEPHLSRSLAKMYIHVDDAHVTTSTDIFQQLYNSLYTIIYVYKLFDVASKRKCNMYIII